MLERGMGQIPLESQTRHQPCPHLDFRLLAFRTAIQETEEILGVLNQQVY
jgi:hypothetical protein